MQDLTDCPNSLPRRLAGAALYALLLTAVTLPIAVWLVGLVVGPPELRAQIVITTAGFGAVHGSLGLYAVILATVAGLTVFNLVVGPRKHHVFDWNLGPRLMDDALSPREKVAIVLQSGWGRCLLALLCSWLVLAAFA
ncbi:MAG: hypothetical protein K2Z80_07605 [Xanthobacteraceae bacterium]|nr:hypothetical protein [Xanthobacteraceae bacterium]